MNILGKNNNKIFLILFGVILAIITVEIALRSSGFILKAKKNLYNKKQTAQTKNYRIMCIGESTTFNQYPIYLEEILRNEIRGINVSVIDCGLPGADTGELVKLLPLNINKFSPDMIVAMMGINDIISTVNYENNALSKFIDNSRFVSLINHLYEKITEFMLKINTPLVKDVNAESYIEINKMIDKMIKLSFKYRSKQEYDKAIELLIDALKHDPNHESVLFELSWLYRTVSDYEKSEKYLKKILRKSQKPIYYRELSYLYLDIKNLQKAISAIKEGYIKYPGDSKIAVDYATYLIMDSKFLEAEKVLLNTLKNADESERVLSFLSELYRKNGDKKKKRKTERLLKKLRRGVYNSYTRINYELLANISRKNKIKLVCVQYPMRPLSSLKRLVGNDPNIIYVDNEKIFKNAVAKEGFFEYFEDFFAGDFGHCTDKGNRLLAENIAKVVIEKNLQWF